MACCGQKRNAAGAEVRSAHHPPVRPASPPPAATSMLPGQNGDRSVTLRYRSKSAVVVQGPATTARYQFAGGGSMQAVDRRDAEALIATGMFERIWG